MSAIKEYLSEINFNVLARSLRSAFQNIIRNPVISLSSILVITLILVLFHVSFALKFFANESIINLGKKVDVIVEVRDGVDFYRIEPLIKRLESIDGINAVQYTDKNSALDEFLKRHVDVKNFLNKYNLENPLPSTIDISSEKVEVLNQAIELLKEKQFETLIVQSKIDTDIDQKLRIENLISVGKFINNTGSLFVMIFIIISALIILNTINVAIYSRKSELHIMNLVGATKVAIQAPFIFEGILFSLISLLLAAVIDVFIHFKVLNLLSTAITNDSILSNVKSIFDNFLSMYINLFMLEGCILIISSMFASFIAIEVYLLRKE